jgi:Flp pilus assembly pilin Flp
MKTLTIPSRRHLELNLEDETGQTMAEYSVVLTLVLIVVGMGMFAVLALAIAGQFDRVTGILS